jgi:membrane glycosyltransferase
LRGRKPFGGHILSHDFVEAALMRRGGWAIHMIPALTGSYEESPPSLADLAVRDRRWCQGNLQHAAVLSGRGLHWVSRLHLLMGIGSYIAAPLWLMFLVASILISVQARFVRPDYFPAGRSLFPAWPVIDPIRAMWVFVGTMAVLLAPKLLTYLVLLAWISHTGWGFEGQPWQLHADSCVDVKLQPPRVPVGAVVMLRFGGAEYDRSLLLFRQRAAAFVSAV